MVYGGESGALRRPTAKWWLITTVVLAGLVEFCCAALVWFVGSDSWVGYSLIAINVLLVLAVAWSICAVFGLIRYRAHLLSAVAPLLVAVTVAVVYTGAAEWSGWQLSKGSLAAAAAECAERSDSVRIGVYTIERVDRDGAECRFYTGGGLIDRVGFAYLPDGPPPEFRASETTYRQYDGSWYRFVVSW
ncbi:hypothetical protein [Nocardia jinanensis]|uniref:Uncharacterized protein n=1 Tax=Nocardia jinanensis TaxID=382504 RepID=A0A917VML8_9NOCA|nr:hypothetical protein [Nocardia jinanensis]GGL00501.1 hypothetical protein GCM10011588_14040 [Nocardia jinanensis]